MIYDIFGLLFFVGLLVIMAFAFWWFWIRKPTTTPVVPVPPVAPGPPTRSFGYQTKTLPRFYKPQNYSQSYSQNSGYESMRSQGYPIPTTNIPESNYTSEYKVDQTHLLELAKKQPAHPTPVFTSPQQNLGNPFVGDLIIPLRRSGVSLPYNASIEDVKTGYFSR